MVLDFGKGSLFRPSGLEQDTGLLKERWAQDGSTLVNAAVFVDASPNNLTVYTVTAGKRLYVNYISAVDGSSDFNGVLKDGGSGGTIKFSYQGLIETSSVYSLPTPIYFDTSVFAEFAATNGYIIITGWEEDLAFKKPRSIYLNVCHEHTKQPLSNPQLCENTSRRFSRRCS